MSLQLAAYWHMMDKKPDRRAILRLDKETGEYEWIEVESNPKEDFEVFLSLLTVYNWQTSNAKWRRP